MEVIMNLSHIKSLVKVSLAVVILLTNAAFKKGDTVQLGRNLNGRTNLNFKKSADNIKLLVKAGTIASVMDYRRLKSGNYGVQVRLDGPEYKNTPESERTVWIYDWKDRDDDVKACADEQCLEPAREMAQAGWAQAIQDQTGTTQTPEPVVLERPKIEAPISTAACQGWDCSPAPATADTQEQIQALTEALPTAREDYEEEQEVTADDVNENISGKNVASGLIFDGGALLPKACHDIVDNHGRVGPVGELLLKSMFRSKYGAGDNNIFLKDTIMGSYQQGRPYGICPGFAKMDRQQKASSLLVLFAALAFKEGSCSKVNDHMAIQRAYGRWSAEKSAASRSLRGEDCLGDIRTDKVQVNCAVDTIAAYGKQGLMDGNDFMGSGYFQPLQDWNKTSIYSKRHKKYVPYTSVKKYMQRIKQCA
jgi:hypothetical protein